MDEDGPTTARPAQPATTVPDVVRRKATVAGAADRITQLPVLVAQLARDCDVEPARMLEGGTESLIVEVRRSDRPSGRPET